MYEPSEEIKKQIAKENWEMLRPGEDWETGGDIKLAFLMVADETVKCSTIKKALELLEAIPDESIKYCKLQHLCKDEGNFACPYLIIDEDSMFGTTITCGINQKDVSESYEPYIDLYSKNKNCPRAYKGDE
jgi:hypothetical protein